MAFLAYQQLSLGSAIGLGYTNTAAAYNGGTGYSAGDIVTYQSRYYAARQSTTGNLPTNTTYWVEISSATNGFPIGCSLIKVRANTEACRYRCDGVNPTASVGMLLQPADGSTADPTSQKTCPSGEIFTSKGGYAVTLSSVKFIKVTGSATLDVEYYS